ncbi:LytR/AlgR family response regulator transcription factor [Thermotalea metallivorans]|uniref:Stage 0 sporulation protein A homolog n=1 Tax=Thermotalea metallivorans TaxID=520762 RepID=A0A140KZC7_9FIRM|nr:LytTR family DNA-binding domain-containing protein [Thermotalea metallivorans]KXG73652.1 Transcriptional regulatory protein NatR [Thermotalea metallivorans]
MGLRVILAEDDHVLAKDLLKQLSAIAGIEVIYMADNGVELLSAVRIFRPEIIIADIDMPAMTGMEAARIIREELPDTEIIFVTSYDMYIKEAVSIYASDYIEKPLNIRRLEETLNRLIRKLSSSQTQLQFHSERGIELINANDIYMVEAFRKRSIIYTFYGDLIIHHSLKEVEDMLTHKIFFKSSRSYIINIQKIASIMPLTRASFQVAFKGKDFKAQLSKERLGELRQKLNS